MKHSVGTKDNLYEKSYAGPPGNNCQRHGPSILQELDKFIFRKMNQKLQQADYLPGNQSRKQRQSQSQSQSLNRSQRQSITDYSLSYTR